MAPLWQTGLFPVIKGQTHTSIKISRSAHNVNQTEYTVRPVLYNLGSHRQTHNTYISALFFSLLFLLTNNISTLCTCPTYGNTLDLMRCPPPHQTVIFKLLQYILLLYLREIHYLGKLCILVQGFLLCRNEHKYKINERVWALNCQEVCILSLSFLLL